MKQTLFLSFFLAAISVSWSQTRIKGVVIDGNGNSIPYVTVSFVNSTEGTISNENGTFYLESEKSYPAVEFSFIGYATAIISLAEVDDLHMKVQLTEETQSLSQVMIYSGKTSKKNNPAIDILRKIWKNKRKNGIANFNQYEFSKHEKIEFDINGIDSAYIKNGFFNGMEFIFDNLDTNEVTGKTFLPIFLNESISKVYGDNTTGKELEVLLGNKNSGFNNHQVLIDKVKGIYREIDVYDNYLIYFKKNFVSPLSTTGIDNYNYVLADSAYVNNKWCYNIVYYPRRENELTFKGNFWVNDTTWAIKKINLEMAEDANVNWVKQIYIQKEFDVLNDSVFLIKKDFFMADLALNKDEETGGFYGKRTVLYDNYVFDKELPQEFYDQEAYRFDKEIYNRDEDFWVRNRLEKLNENEVAVYQLLDTLKSVKAFKNLFDITTILATGYVEMNGWDYGPVFSSIGYNEVEGLRLRVGGRTYFTQNDTWRVEGYTAYGFKDNQFKYGILGKVLLDPKSRLIVSLGRRRDIEQLGASLTNGVDILGRSYASSALLNMGDNDKLSSIEVTTGSVEIEPWNNFTVRVNGSLRDIKPASEGFSFNYYTDESFTQTASTINQTEVSTIFTYTPRRKTSGFGVEQNRIGKDFPTFFLSYSLGIKDLLESDFDYKRLQFFYDQPLMIGGFGRARVRLEAGKIFGQVPLALLSVLPGNQSYFQNKNSFNLLNYYEFVTDTYVAFHFEHNFNGRLFSRIPGIRELNLREIVGIRAAWGQISDKNKEIDASGLSLTAPSEKPYWEYSLGISNIFKILRFDAHFRGNYFDNPDARSFAITGSFDIHF